MADNDITSHAGLEELSVSEKGPPRWYVMRDLRRANANLPAYKQLTALNMEIFTPMKERLVTKMGKRIRKEVPFLPDLLFVHADRDTLDPIVEKIPTLQYRFMKGNAYRSPMVVPTEDMNRFMHAVRVTENPHYYAPEEITPAICGSRIKIIGGKLDNYEGFLLTVRGSKHKRLLVNIPNLISVGVQISDCEYIVIAND